MTRRLGYTIVLSRGVASAGRILAGVASSVVMLLLLLMLLLPGMMMVLLLLLLLVVVALVVGGAGAGCGVARGSVGRVHLVS